MTKLIILLMMLTMVLTGCSVCPPHDLMLYTPCGSMFLPQGAIDELEVKPGIQVMPGSKIQEDDKEAI